MSHMQINSTYDIRQVSVNCTRLIVKIQIVLQTVSLKKEGDKNYEKLGGGVGTEG